MSSIAQVERPAPGSKLQLSKAATRHEVPLGYFTSWRSAVASFIILAVVLAALILDLVAPLLG
jgi:hypothetical protein